MAADKRLFMSTYDSVHKDLTVGVDGGNPGAALRRQLAMLVTNHNCIDLEDKRPLK